MGLIDFLAVSVIFCALALVVSGGGGKGDKIVPSILIVGEVYVLLLQRGILGAPIGTRADVTTAMSVLVAISALVALLRLGEKSFSLLAMFAALEQMLVSLGVIHN